MNDDNNKIRKVVTTRMSDISSTIRATIHKQGERNIMENIKNGSGYEGVIEQTETKYRVRKLTPTECWKLMDMKEKDVQMARGLGLSNSQLYKQAGNGIVANCVSLLFEHLYKAQYDKSFICTDENFIFPQQ